jgi:hypothetical protein
MFGSYELKPISRKSSRLIIILLSNSFEFLEPNIVLLQCL